MLLSGGAQLTWFLFDCWHAVCWVLWCCSAFPIVVGVCLLIVLAVGVYVMYRTCRRAGWTSDSMLVHSYSTCILMGP